tara:strand:- start:10631 stop:11647 length:1017 start_codon:yes stop_codon:yes gene_type:complete
MSFNELHISLQNLEINWVRDLRIGGLLSGIYDPQTNTIPTAAQVNDILTTNNLNSGFSYIPVLIPAFNSETDTYEIDESLIADTLFLSNKAYVGYRNFMAFGNRFLTCMPDINDRAQVIISHNLNVKTFVSTLKSKGNTICAFQTRNIPHNGHIKILEYLLEVCDHVVINPVIGIKKPGDTLIPVLKEAYEYVITNILKTQKLHYVPVYADMYYAGPREAAHHALIRQNLGFTHFSVGRDHAGAENLFHPEDAVNFISEIKSDLEIEVFTLPGAYYCNSCMGITIKDCCADFANSSSKENISGTDLRNSINNQSHYAHLDSGLISHITNQFGEELFES